MAAGGGILLRLPPFPPGIRASGASQRFVGHSPAARAHVTALAGRPLDGPRPGACPVAGALPAGARRSGVSPRAALFTSTCLPLVVAITTIGVDQRLVDTEQAASLVGAAMVSVLVFPLLATRLRARGLGAPGAAEAEEARGSKAW